MSTERYCHVYVGITLPYAQFVEQFGPELPTEDFGDDFFEENEGYCASNLEVIGDWLDLYHNYEQGHINLGVKVSHNADQNEIISAFQKAELEMIGRFGITKDDIRLRSTIFSY